jgi:hypothetical protein
MKSGTKNLLIVAACIVVLGGITAALVLTDNKKGDDVSPSASAAEIGLVTKTKVDIVSMSVKNQKGSYNIVPKKQSTPSAASGSSEDNIEFEIKELKGIPSNKTAIDQVVQNGYSLFATKNIGTMKNLDEFGLKNPSAQVNVTFKDGSTYNYYIGNSSPSDTTAYYMCGEKSNNVYIVSIDAGLLENINYFVNKDILFVTNGAGENDFTKITLSGKNYPKPVTLQNQNNMMILTSPYRAPVNEEKLEQLKTMLSNIIAENVEAVNVPADKLKTYGFETPTAQVDFNLNKTDYTLKVGNKKEDNYYVMLNGVNVVYEVKPENINEIVSSNAFSFRNKNVLANDIESVKSVVVKIGNETSTFTVNRKKDETKSTEDNTVYIYSVDMSGKNIDYETKYKNFYNKATEIQLLEPTETKPTGTPVLSLEYAYFDRNDKDTVLYYKTGDRRYTAVLNGSVCGIVTSDNVERLIDAKKSL